MPSCAEACRPIPRTNDGQTIRGPVTVSSDRASDLVLLVGCSRVGLTCALPARFVIFPSPAKIVSQAMSGSHHCRAVRRDRTAKQRARAERDQGRQDEHRLTCERGSATSRARRAGPLRGSAHHAYCATFKSDHSPSACANTHSKSVLALVRSPVSGRTVDERQRLTHRRCRRSSIH